ncbi:MAG: sporulation protein YqfC [Clostridiales bacterium]|nr:sporulation protein YqfC [Clostridiales bacterium]
MFKKKINNNEKKINIFKEKIANTLDMSKEIILGTVKITFIGNKEVTIENYKGIIEYTENLIKIRALPQTIKLCGKKFEIKTITQEMFYITGIIDSLEFLK